MKNNRVIGIDPGISGAIILTDGEKEIRWAAIPIGPDRSVSFSDFHAVMSAFGGEDFSNRPHVFLERAVSFGMGTKSAFNYGRGFEAITIALGLLKFPYTLVEPAKWTKVMHEGTAANLKPKARSLIAVQRLFPTLVGALPKKPRGGIHDGFIDALLIAGYGLRKLGVSVVEDFF